MKPSQLFLRSLKVIKENSKKHESNHHNKMKTGYKNINLEKPDGRRFKENGRACKKVSKELPCDNCGTTDAYAEQVLPAYQQKHYF